jgi:hypothetical protein
MCQNLDLRFPAPFSLFCLSVLLSFLLFLIWFFYRPLFFPSFLLLFYTLFFAHVVSSLAYPILLGNKRLGCCCCCICPYNSNFGSRFTEFPLQYMCSLIPFYSLHSSWFVLACMCFFIFFLFILFYECLSVISTLYFYAFVISNINFLHCHVQIDENVQREIINHRSLKHPNIIRFKEVSWDHDNLLFAIFEYQISYGN